MGWFTKRSDSIEQMDDLECSGPVVDQALRELETINLWLGGNAVTMGGMKLLLKSSDSRERTVDVVDLGCGGGDMLYLLSGWGRRNNYRFQLTGIDANPNIIDYARTKFQGTEIRFKAMNIFSDEFKSMTFDIVIGTLFFHHFTDEQLVGFFRQLRSQARLGWIVNDIHRHWFAYHSIKMITQLFSRSPMVKADAPVSVLRAFRKSELISILRRAGVERYELRWRWAFRWQVVVFV